MINFSDKRIRYTILLFLCNVLLFLYLLVPCFHREVLTIAQEELLHDRGDDTYETGFYTDLSYEGEHRIVTEPLFLRRGFYAVTVSLDTNNGAVKKRNEKYGCYLVVMPEGEEIAGHRAGQIESDRVEVFQGQEEVSFTVYVRYGGEFRPMVCLSDASDELYTIVYGMNLSYLQKRTVLFTAVHWLFRLILLDLLVLSWIWRRERTMTFFRNHALSIAGIGTVTFLAYYPYLNGSLFFEGDLWYHMNRIRYLAQGLASGSFPVRIHPGWANGYGYAAGVFYGDLFLLPSALLLNLGYTMNAVYKFHVLQMSLIAACASYAAGKRISGHRLTALFCCCLYTLSMQRVMMITPFHMVGQYDACSFLPLVVAAFYGIYAKEEKRRTSDVLMLAAGLTGIMESHVLTTFLAAVAVILFALLLWRRTFSKEVLRPLCEGLGLAVLLNLFYLIPFADYMIRQPFRGNNFRTSLWFWAPDMMSLMARNDLEPLEGKTIGIIPFLVIAMTLALLLAGWFHMRTNEVAVTTGTTILFLFAGTSFFPYFWIHYHLPGVESVLNNLQFPDRFLIIVSALCLGLFALSMRTLTERGKETAVIAAGAVLCCLCLMQMLDYYKDLNTFGHPIELYDADAKLDASPGAEFTIPGSIESGIYERVTNPQAENEEALVLSETQKRGTTITTRVENLTGEAQALNFPLWAYRGYAARSDAGRLIVSEASDHRVQVLIPAQYQGEVRVFFREPWYWRLSELISLLAVILLVRYILQKFRRPVDVIDVNRL